MRFLWSCSPLYSLDRAKYLRISSMMCEKFSYLTKTRKNLSSRWWRWTFFDWLSLMVLSWLLQTLLTSSRRMFNVDLDRKNVIERITMQILKREKIFRLSLEYRRVRRFWGFASLFASSWAILLSSSQHKTSESSHKGFLRRFSLPLNTENSNRSALCGIHCSLRRQKRRFWGFRETFCITQNLSWWSRISRKLHKISETKDFGSHGQGRVTIEHVKIITLSRSLHSISN